jgi:hypothetical protein
MLQVSLLVALVDSASSSRASSPRVLDVLINYGATPPSDAAHVLSASPAPTPEPADALALVLFRPVTPEVAPLEVSKHSISPSPAVRPDTPLPLPLRMSAQFIRWC